MGKIVGANRYDVVGSFLRPERLKEARRDFEAKKITFEELTKIEDECITELVKKQKENGLRVITDGEFRRATWHFDFFWGFNGIEHCPTKNGIPFHGENAMLDDTYLVGKLSVDTHPFVNHYKFVKQFEDENTVAKQTIPAPAQFLKQLILSSALENTFKFYNSVEEVIDAIVVVYKKVIKDLYDAGCRTIQFDDCSWGVCVDEEAYGVFGVDEKGLEDILEKLLLVNNLAVEGKPNDLAITTHVCRGNFHSTYARSGGYDKVAKFLFARENVSDYFLEFDDERSGGFEPLKEVNGDKKVVLGLITSKFPKLEDKEVIKAKIQEASKYVPLERLCLSPQCGFASCEIGNILTEEEQWAKVRLVVEIAKEVWGDC